MKKKCFTLTLTLLLLTVLFSGSVFAAEQYTTNTYDVTMTVNENHAYDINEKFDVTFTQPQHGLFRYIPYSGTFYRQIDGEKSAMDYKAVISNIDVPHYNFDVSSENGSKIIRIGDKNDYVDGNQSYNLSYTWDPGNDNIDQFDDVYYNILPSNWLTAIENASFTINMP
ncbi:MAG: DUF2207 domain-containing protein, partial [Eubacterium sp.]